MELVEYRPAKTRPLAPLCSVCIAHYRGPELLATCLDSLLEQDCDFEFEIIVHDDASNDGSLEFLSREYPQVEVLVSAENVGFCIANNRMVAQARGQYVLLLNNDAALFPDALCALLQTSAQGPSGILRYPSMTGRAAHWSTGAVCSTRSTTLCPIWIPAEQMWPWLSVPACGSHAPTGINWEDFPNGWNPLARTCIYAALRGLRAFQCELLERVAIATDRVTALAATNPVTDDS